MRSAWLRRESPVTTGSAGGGTGGRAATVTRSNACTRVGASKSPRARRVITSLRYAFCPPPLYRYHVSGVDVDHVRAGTARTRLADWRAVNPVYNTPARRCGRLSWHAFVVALLVVNA